MNKPTPERIFIAGHRGMVGAALVRALHARGDCELLLRNRDELDLCNAAAVDAFFAESGIDTVYLAAARVGGIHANQAYPAEFIHQNLEIANAVIHAAWKHRVQRLLFLGSSCIYPRAAPQPMREECLLSGALEPTNEPYAIAKIAGIKLCESYNRQFGTDFRCLMPTNLYGPGDNFHREDSHVLPALIRRFHDALQTDLPEVRIWGSGTPLREFLYVDDLAAACLHLMAQPRERLAPLITPQRSHLNVGSGEEVGIATLAMMVAEALGYRGHISFDRSHADGTPRKLLDSSRLRSLGWAPAVPLADGLCHTVRYYLDACAAARQELANAKTTIGTTTATGTRATAIPSLRH